MAPQSRDQSVRTKKFKYKPLHPGFDWSVVLRIPASPFLFPAGSTFKAQVRYDEGEAVLTTLTTALGTLTRVDDERIEIKIPGSASTKWIEPAVMLDLVRTDLSPAQHLAIRVQIEVQTSLTVR